MKIQALKAGAGSCFYQISADMKILFKNFSPKETFSSIMAGRSILETMARLLSIWEESSSDDKQVKAKMGECEFLNRILANIVRIN